MPVLSNSEFENFGAPAAGASASPAGSFADRWAGLNEAAPKTLSSDQFENFNPQKPPQQLPDVGAPLLGGGPQISPGLPAFNEAADSASQTAHKAITNLPGSAGEFAKNTVAPLLHPIETVDNVKNLGMGVLEKTGILPGSEHEKYADAVGQFFKDRYGSLEAARKTLEEDPVGMAGDLSMLLTGGGSAAARLPGTLGKVGEVARTAGSTIDPLRAAAPIGHMAGNIAGNVATHTLGMTTGIGEQPIKVAAHAGYEGGPGAQAFRDSITGRTPMAQVVEEARGAIDQLRRERGAAYRAGMAHHVANDKTILSWNDVDTALNDMDKVATYKGVSLSPSTEGIRARMNDVINGWKNLRASEFWTPEGFDALKKRISDIRDETQPHTKERVVADQLYQAIRKTIVDQAPGYARVMLGYEEASDLIGNIERELSLKPNANIDTGLRKLQSVLRDNVNTSFGRRRELANYLVSAGAPNLLERLAGQSLHSWTPRGVARGVIAGADLPAIGGAIAAGHLPVAAAMLATLPTMSPRLMGNAAYGAGAAARYARPVARALVRPRLARQIGQATAAAPFENQNNPFAP